MLLRMFVMLVGSLIVTLLPAPARAATIIVTTGADSGPGSLRQAIAGAGSGATITFAPEVTTVTLTSDQLTIATDLTIDGGTGVTIARSPAENTPTFRIFAISEGTVTFDSLTLRNGTTLESGGGIFIAGSTLTLRDSTFTGNAAAINGGGITNASDSTLIISSSTFTDNTTSSSGGAIANLGTLTIANSTFTGNAATFDGGALANVGTVQLTNSTFTGNTADNYGGAITPLGGTLTIVNSTLSGNTAVLGGGGIATGGTQLAVTTTIVNSTLTDNGAAFGGGITNMSATLTLANVIIAKSTGGGIDNRGTLTVLGTNIIETPIAGEGTITGADTIITGDPLLGPLADHGGPTQTHLPQPDSPAIDAGDPRVLSETFLAVDLTGDGDTDDSLTRDQRGFARITGDSVDIGAVEVGASPTAIGITASPTQIAEAPDDDPTTTLISITRRGDLSTAGSVDIALGGTATVGDDYTLTFDETSGAAFADTTLTFNPGTTTATFTLTVLDDDTVEPDETVLITLSNGTAPNPVTLDPSGTTLTIIDDDQPVSGGDISVIYLPFVVR